MTNLEGNNPDPENLDNFQESKQPEVGKFSNPERPKKTTNWRWAATHLLPIFLILVVAFGVAIATVPSFKKPFLAIINKLDIRADVNYVYEKPADQLSDQEKKFREWSDKQIIDKDNVAGSWTSSDTEKCNIFMEIQNKIAEGLGSNWSSKPSADSIRSDVTNNGGLIGEFRVNPESYGKKYTLIQNKTQKEITTSCEMNPGPQQSYQEPFTPVTQDEFKIQFEIKPIGTDKFTKLIFLGFEVDKETLTSGTAELRYSGEKGSIVVDSVEKLSSLEAMNIQASDYDAYCKYDWLVNPETIKDPWILGCSAEGTANAYKLENKKSIDHSSPPHPINTVFEAKSGYLPTGTYEIVFKKGAPGKTTESVDFTYDNGRIDKQFPYPTFGNEHIIAVGDSDLDQTAGDNNGSKNFKDLFDVYKSYNANSCVKLVFYEGDVGPTNDVLVYPDATPKVGIYAPKNQPILANYSISAERGYFTGMLGQTQTCLVNNGVISGYLGDDGKTQYYNQNYSLMGDSYTNLNAYLYNNKLGSNKITFKETGAEDQGTSVATLNYVTPKAEMTLSDTPYLKNSKFSLDDNGNYVVNQDDIVKTTAILYKVTDEKDTRKALLNYAFGIQLPGLASGKAALVFQPSADEQVLMKKDEDKINDLYAQVKDLADQIAKTENSTEKDKLTNRKKDLEENQIPSAINASYINKTEGDKKPTWFEISSTDPQNGWLGSKMASNRIVTENTSYLFDPNNQNKAFGRAIFYIKPTADKSDGATKLKFISPRYNYLNNPFQEWQTGYKNLTTDTTNGYGLSFTHESKATLEFVKDDTCMQLDTSREAEINKALDTAEPGITLDKPKKQNVLTKIKNYFANVKGKLLALVNKKVYSEESTGGKCACFSCVGIDVSKDVKVNLFQKEYLTFKLKFSNPTSEKMDNVGVYAEIPDYLSPVSKNTISIEDGTSYLLLNEDNKEADSIKGSQMKNYEFKVKLNDITKLPENGIITLKTYAKINGKKLPGETLSVRGVDYGQGKPTDEIYKIKRDLNNDGKITDDEIFYKNPDLSLNQKVIPTYKDEKGTEHEKLYPGDTVYYSAKFKKDKTFFDNFDLIARYSDSAEDFGEVKQGSNGAESEVTLKGDSRNISNKKLIYEHFIFPTSSGQYYDWDIEWKYWVKLSDKIDIGKTQVGSWAKIGSIKNKSGLWGEPLVDIQDLNFDWLTNDLFGFIDGKITDYYGKPVPKINTEIQILNPDGSESVYNPDSYSTDLNKKDSTNYKNLFTDKDGNFLLEYDRAKDLKNSKKLAIKVTYQSYTYKNDKELSLDIPGLEIYSNYNINSNSAYNKFEFYTKPITIQSSKLTDFDLNLESNKDKDKIDYHMTDITPYKYGSDIKDHEAMTMALEIFTNLVSASDYLNDNVPYLKNNLPENKVVLDNNYDWASYNGNGIIRLGKPFFKEITDRNPQTELHEFAHSLLGQVGGFKKKDFSPTCADCADDKIPYKVIDNNHWGIYNDYSSDALLEGFAEFMQVYLNQKIDSNFSSWTAIHADGSATFNYNGLIPDIFSRQSDTPSFEERSVSQIFRELITGTPKEYLVNELFDNTYPWLGDFKVEGLASFSPHPERFPEIVTSMLTDGINTIGGLYNNLTTKYDKKEIKNTFILHGIFKDENCDSWYQQNEIVGEPAQCRGLENMSSISFPIYNDLGKTVWKNGAIGTLSARPWREFPPDLPGANIKINFKDSNGTAIQEKKIKIDYIFDAPFEKSNYSNTVNIENGSLAYIEFPASIYDAKVVISVEGSNDKYEIKSQDYWPVINSLIYSYFAEKTFTIGGTTPAQTTVPSVEKPKNDDGNAIAITRGGDNIILDAQGFKDAKKVDVYIGKNKVAEAPVVSDSFGLNILVPDSTGLGKKTIKLLADTGASAETSVWITQNKWFNKNIWAIFLVSLMIALFIYLIFRLFKNNYFSKHNFVNSAAGKLSMIVILIGITSLLSFTQIKYLIAADHRSQAEKDALVPATMENVRGFIRMPESAVASDNTTVIDSSKYYGVKTPLDEEWGRPKMICFLERLAYDWYNVNINYFMTAKKMSREDAVKMANEDKLIINDMSMPDGRVYDHAGHTNGLDVDMWARFITPYVGDEIDPQPNSEWKDNKELAQKFADLINSYNKEFNIKVIYLTSPDIKGVTNITGHNVHWHVSLNSDSK